jgi:hypothetical protein
MYCIRSQSKINRTIPVPLSDHYWTILVPHQITITNGSYPIGVHLPGHSPYPVTRSLGSCVHVYHIYNITLHYTYLLYTADKRRHQLVCRIAPPSSRVVCAA